MKLLFIGKRFNTNRDSYEERFGRIYQIPYQWAESGRDAKLWLIDYHTRKHALRFDQRLRVATTPVFGLSFFRECWTQTIGQARRLRKPDVIIASGDCYIGILGYLIARLLRVPFVFDIYDKYDEFSGYRRILVLDPQSFLLRHSDAVSFASRALQSQLGADIKRSIVIPNGIDTTKFRPLERSDSRRVLKLPVGKTLVGYFGSMEPERGVNDLIDAIGILRQEDTNIELVLAGKADKTVNLDQEWLHYLGNLPFEQVPAALASCDVLALPYRTSPFLDMASSCKIAEYIAAQRPIVATRTPNMLENFPDQANQLNALIASPCNVSELAESIRCQLIEKRLVSMPANFAWRDITATFAGYLEEALAHPSVSS